MWATIGMKVFEYLIMFGVKWLVESKNEKIGIGKDLALAMVEGVKKSELNPTTSEMFVDAVSVLKGA